MLSLYNVGFNLFNWDIKDMEQMYILIVIKTNECYYSKVLKPLCSITNRSTKTLRTWLQQPKTALKQGYMIGLATRLKSKQGGNNPNFGY